MDDTQDLVQRCIAGDEAAWQDMVARYRRLVYHVLRSFHLDDGECDDVAQHCWLELVQRIHTIRDPQRCGDWLATVARHEAIKVLRRRGRTVPVADLVVIEDRSAGSDPESAVLADELRLEVLQALSELPERAQQFLAHFVTTEPVRYEDVARATGLRSASVGRTRARYLRRLRDVLEERGVAVTDLAS